MILISFYSPSGALYPCRKAKIYELIFPWLVPMLVGACKMAAILQLIT